MKQATLRWVIGLMGFAMIGLVTFQLYWADTLIRANNQQFQSDVKQALMAVSEKLEEQEASSPLNQNWTGNFSTQFSFSSGISPLSYGNSGTNQPKLFNADSLSQINGLDLVFDLQKATLAHGGFQSDQSINQPQRNLSSNSQMFFQVLENMFLPQRPLLTRFNPDKLDSIITRSLQNKGIDIDFDYGIISPSQNRFILINNRTKNEALAKSELKATLFPNDITSDVNWLVVDFPEQEKFLLKKLWITMVSSGVLIMMVIGSFGYSIHTIIKQKKLSEMKTDFINNMTHELKTPIATISLASEALSDKDIQQLDEMRDRYVKVISEENHRLSDQVERVLQMAAIEKRDLNLQLENLSINEIATEAYEVMKLRVEAKNGVLKKSMEVDADVMIEADHTHMMNILVNLIDNALKYSGENPNIFIRTWNNKKFIYLSVKDHGIGMSREAQKHIFDKFFRVSTGNIHNVKGFGLGLSYVKNMVIAHHGDISVDSTLHKGSTFTISLPIAEQKG